MLFFSTRWGGYLYWDSARCTQFLADYTRPSLSCVPQIRKWSDPVDNGANLLVAVPGGGDGPGGVLVCSENFIIYKNQDHEDVRAVIPRRSDLLADRGVLIVCYATHKKKAYSFFLVQVRGGEGWLESATLSVILRIAHQSPWRQSDASSPSSPCLPTLSERVRGHLQGDAGL